MSKTEEVAAVHTRWMIRRDLAGAVAVEAATGGTWDADAFEARLRNRNEVGIVAEVADRAAGADRIAGHLVYRLTRDAVTVLNLRAVAVGALVALAEKAVYKVAQHRREVLNLPYRLARPLAGAVLCCPEDPGLERVYLSELPVGPWVSATARQLIAGGADPDIVADALEEAGCPDDGLLADLRAGGSLAALIARGLGESLDLV